MGGSKSRTYTDIQANKLFDPNTNLFQKELVRIFALTKDIEPLYYTRTILNSINKYLSFAVFEKLGIGYNLSIVASQTIENIPLYVISQQIPEENHIVFAGINRKTYLDEYVSKYFETNYTVVQGFEDIITVDINLDIEDYYIYCALNSGCDTPTVRMNIVLEEEPITLTAVDVYRVNCDGDTNYSTCATLDGTTEYKFTVQKNITFNLYQKTDTSGFKVVLPIDIDLTKAVLVDEYLKDGNGNWYSSGNQYRLFVPEDARTRTTFAYVYRNDTSQIKVPTAISKEYAISTDGLYVGFIDDLHDNFLKEAASKKTLILPIKHNGNFVSLEYKNKIYSMFGLKEDDMQDNLSQSELKEAFIAYTLPLTYGIYNVRKKLEEIYKSNFVSSVSISTSQYTIEYRNVTETDYDVTGTTTSYRQITINGITKRINDSTNIYILSDDMFDKLTLTEKFRIIKDALSIIAGTEVTVKLKWYQTAFFRFVLTIASLAMGYYIGGIQGLAITAGGIAIKEIFGEDAAMIFSIITFTYINLDKIKNISLSKINITDFAKKYWFDIVTKGIDGIAYLLRQEIKEIGKDIKELQEETEKMAKEIKEMFRNAIYNPLSQYNSYYDFVYNAQYNMYNSSNFEPLAQLNRRMQWNSYM